MSRFPPHRAAWILAHYAPEFTVSPRVSLAPTRINLRIRESFSIDGSEHFFATTAKKSIV